MSTAVATRPGDPRPLAEIAADVKARNPILDYVRRHTRLQQKCKAKGGGYEYCGPCPIQGCTAQSDGFVVFDAQGRYFCRKCTPRGGDVIALDRAIHGGTFWDAVQRLGGERPAGAGRYITAPPPISTERRSPKPRVSQIPRKVAEHFYKETDGTILYRKDRWEPAKHTPGRDKDFLSYHPDPTTPGAWLDGRGEETPLVLYNWPAIYQAGAGALLCLTEGEGKADALTALGLLAGSADGPWRDDYTRQVRGLDLVIFQDNDQHGADHTAKIAASCAGIVPRIRVVAWPEKPAGYDIGDWLAEGHTVEELHTLIAAAPEWYLPTDADSPAEPPASRLRTLAELAALPPPTWLVDGLIPRGVLAAIFGPSGVCKSFMALDWALTVATGAGDWFDHRTQTGPVIYLAAEGYTNLVKRATAWQESRGRHNVDKLYVWPEVVNMMDPAAVELMIADVETRIQEAPALIIVDTLARCMPGGDENSAKDMGLFVAGADRLRTATGATILIIHHTGVAEGRERGSTALRAAVDTMLAQSKDDQVVTLECVKQKDAPEFEPSAWQMTPAADSIVLTPASAAALAGTQAQMTPDQRAVLTFLASPILAGGATSAEITSGTQIPPHRVYRALNGLEARGHLDFDGPPKSRNRHFWPSASGRAVIDLTHSTNKSLTVSDRESAQHLQTHNTYTPLRGVSVCESVSVPVGEPSTQPEDHPDPRAYWQAIPPGKHVPDHLCQVCQQEDWGWHDGVECKTCHERRAVRNGAVPHV